MDYLNKSYIERCLYMGQILGEKFSVNPYTKEAMLSHLPHLPSIDYNILAIISTVGDKPFYLLNFLTRKDHRAYQKRLLHFHRTKYISNPSSLPFYGRFLGYRQRPRFH